MLIPFSDHIFGIVGHDELVRQHEAAYFRILCLGAAPAIASSALSGFFSGRGKTWPVMWVSVLATAVNIIMDYLLIFGNGGLPELGIVGAGLATVLSACFSFSLYMALEIFNADIYAGWTIASAYIIILGFIFLIRFLGGKWKSMRVIEKAPPPMPPALPESPVIDLES